MADQLLSELFARYRGPMGSVEDRRRQVNDLEQLLRYNESAERLAANERYAAQPIVPKGTLSFDAGYWDMDRLPAPSGLAALAQRYGRPAR
jgi:hypothetical protein